MLKKNAIFLLLFHMHVSASATNYYINAQSGNDKNAGQSKALAWQSIKPLSQVIFAAGDSILLAKGQKFWGCISLINVAGTEHNPIVLTSYQATNKTERPILDADVSLNAIYVENSSYIKIINIEITATVPYRNLEEKPKAEMRCGILVKVTNEQSYQHIAILNVLVHDVYYHAKGYTRTVAETASANGTQSYGWGIRFINDAKLGQLSTIKIQQVEVYNVCHTGIKFTATANGIKEVDVANCYIHNTGGPGLQLSGVTNAHIHHNKINYSGSKHDSRNWARGSGMWTWSCNNILIEHNRFENANGPGDSAGVHIDFNCRDVIVQYNLSANNAGGFCEILGNNFNCAYRYNVSINDGYRIKGVDGAFQEGKIFWLSGYQGNNKEKAGPYNSYFYNNTIYISNKITPRIAITTSANGVLIANNIFYFENPAIKVMGDQKKNELDMGEVPNFLSTNNLFLQQDSWPAELNSFHQSSVIGNPNFKLSGGLDVKDYIPNNSYLIKNKGVKITPIPSDGIGLKIGLTVEKDILGNIIKDLPDIGAIELY